MSEMDYSYEERQRIVTDELYQKFFIETPIGDVEFTIGAQAGNDIQVDAQIVDPAGDPMEDQYGVDVFITDDADGLVPTASAPDGGIAISEGSVLNEVVADTQLLALTGAAGLMSLVLTHAGAATTWHVAIKLPNGLYAISGEVAFS